jgi:hypothetical protein
MVLSRWPQRLRFAASMSCSTSAAVRCSRLRSSALGRRFGVTVRSISSDPAFFHFGGGMSVRNLCRQRLGDRELAAYCPFGGDWDSCYIGVLAAIAATPVRQGPVSRPQPRQLQFSFIEPNC